MPRRQRQQEPEEIPGVTTPSKGAQAEPPIPGDYRTSLPSPSYIRDLYSQLLEEWRPRNEHIRRVREYIEGRNVIRVPNTLQYPVVAAHTYTLQAVINEKVSRFMPIPRIQAIPEGISTGSRTASTKLENWINSCFYWMEQRGDSDTWQRVILDAIALDQGVERIECAPAPFWPELAVVETESGEQLEPLYQRFIEEYGYPSREELGEEWFMSTGEENEAGGMIFPNEQSYREYLKYREKYKRTAGPPFRAVYVPLQDFFPVYEAATPVEVIQREVRSLRSVLNSPLFAGPGLEQLRSSLGQLNPAAMLKSEIIILHYVNLSVHAYFALIPAADRQRSQSGPSSPLMVDPVYEATGQPVFLYAYRHNLGRVIYNIVAGRFGGWKTQHNDIEHLMKALCDLQQNADDVYSQALSRIAQTDWPTIVEEHDPELRDVGKGPPTPITIQPGAPIAIWKGERIYPLIQAADNPVARWAFDQITRQMELLSGASAVYGQREPGVRTGYHAQLQISQSEHLDERIEYHLVQGAIQRAHLVLLHARQLNESIPVHYRVKRNGQVSGEYITLTPKMLSHLPELDATVRRPRPIDYDAALRAAITASQDRGGPGTPLLDDDTIRERILGEESPDEIKRKIYIQNEERKLLASGILSQMIGQRLGIILAQRQKPDLGPEQFSRADPALLQALARQNASGRTAGFGGVNPADLAGQLEGAAAQGVPLPGQPGGPQIPPQPPPGMRAQSAIMGQGGGYPPGVPQPAQRVADAIKRARL